MLSQDNHNDNAYNGLLDSNGGNSRIVYITEEIKDIRGNSKEHRWYSKVAFTVVLAVVFGTVFQFTVSMTGPIFDKWAGKDEDKNTAKEVAKPFELMSIQPRSFWNMTTLMRDELKVPEPNFSSNATEETPSDIDVRSEGMNGLGLMYTDVVEAMMPSIVTITCLTTEVDWFDNEYEHKGTGTGIIMGVKGSDIIIATNYSIVHGAERVNVTFVNQNKVEARVLGFDEEADLCALAVNSEDLLTETSEVIQIAALANSEEVKVGDIAIALGNPLGYGKTMTRGVISSLNRELRMTDRSLKLFQTDAKMNGGNFGGPLVNGLGEVIGINTVKFNHTDAEGMNYVIPINRAKEILDNLVKQKPQAVFGIVGQAVTEDIGIANELPIGIYVSELKSGTPAYASGLEIGDIILEMSGAKLETMTDFQRELGKYLPDYEVKLKIYRKLKTGHKQMEISVKLGSK